MFTAESDTQRLRFIADVYGKATIDKLKEEQKNQTPDEIIKYLCTDKQYGYGINQKKYSKEEVLKLINIRYAMSLYGLLYLTLYFFALLNHSRHYLQWSQNTPIRYKPEAFRTVIDMVESNGDTVIND